MTILVLGISLMLILLVYMTFMEPYRVVIERVTIRDPLLAETLKGLRIVHLSDLHLKNGLGLRERRLLEKLGQIQPDLIFISGDFIDSRDAIPTMHSFARSSAARIGVFAVPGNNDHHSIHHSELLKVLADTPVTVLRNANLRLSLPNGKQIYVAGVDDPTTGHDDFARALPLAPDIPVIMLCHSPAVYKAASQKGVNLLLVGHTHGGQLRMPGIVQIFHRLKGGGPILGLYKEKDTFMYVNRGIGTRTIPFRFLCPPEITIFTFDH